MNSIKFYFLLSFSFLLIVSNIYSQTERFDELLENRINKPLHNTHNDIMDDFPNSEKYENRTFVTMKKQVYDSSSVIDSVVSIQANGAKSKYIYIYDSNGNMTSELGEDLDGSQWLNNKYRITYTYDSNGNNTSFLYEKWDKSQWVNVYRTTSTYDSNGNNTSFLYEYWDGSQWLSGQRHTYTYDSNGNNTSFLFDNWDGSQWVNVSRTTSTYDSNGNMTLKLWERWDESQWVSAQRYTYTYDSNGNMTLELMEDWDGSQWVGDWRTTYTYDSNGNMTYFSSENWDGSQWVGDWRYTYAYDSNGNMTYFSSENWDGSQWIISNGNCSFYDSFGRGYSFTSAEINVFYSPITDVIESNEVINKFSLSQNYPNPFNPSTALKYEIPKESYITLKVYDILGREVVTLVNQQQKTGYYEVDWNAVNNSSGIYFYKIQAGEFVATKKMILMK